MCDKLKKIFVLGGSMLQVPTIQALKEKDLYVYVLDYDPNAVGREYADVFLEISTIDFEAVYEAAVKYKPDYIMTSTSDMPVRTVAWACNKLDMPVGVKYDSALCATDKALMRERMKECGVPIPEFKRVLSYDDFVNAIDSMSTQCVVKPTDNAASRGVVLVDKNNQVDYEGLYQYCKQYARGGELLVEEYMDGPEVSVEGFSINGEPHIITMTDKKVTEHPFFVELGHTEPSRLPNDIQRDIEKVAYQAIKAIGIENGPSHTEIKITSNGVKLVEIAARLGGDFITSKLVPLSTGVDLTLASVNATIGEDVDLTKRFERGASIRFITGHPGVIKSVSGCSVAEKITGVREVVLYKGIGDSVSAVENSSDRIGHIIAVGKDADEADDIEQKALDLIKIYIK